MVRIPGQGAAFILSVLVARILMPKDYGILGVAMMLIGYSNLLTNFGLKEAIIQKKIYDARTLRSIFTFDLAVSSALTLAFFAAAGFIAAFFKTPEAKNVIRVMSLVFVITSFTGLPQVILRRDMNFKAVSLIDVTQSLLMYGLTYILALNQFGYWSLVYGQLIPLILTAVLLCVKAGWVPVISYDHNSLKRIFNFGVWNFLKSQLEFIAQHTDRFIIGRWLGAVSLGFYEKALSTATMPYNSLAMNINGVMFSAFSKYSDDGQQLRQHFKKSLTLLSLINYPIYLGLIIIAPYLVQSLFGEKWSSMTIPMQLILVGCIFRTFNGLTASLNVGVGKYKTHTKRFFFAWIFFVLSCVLLLRLGIVGIALSYLIFNVMQTALWLNLSIKTIDLRWKDVWGSILPASLASLFMAVVTIAVSRILLPQRSFLNMIALVIIGIFSYCIVVFYDKSELTREFRKLAFQDIKKKISTSMMVQRQ